MPMNLPTKPILPPPPGLGAAPSPSPASPPLPDFTVYGNPLLRPGGAGPLGNTPFDPSVLPDGATMYDDGSVSLTPEAARTVFANQAGGPGAMPPGPPPLPPDMAAALPLLDQGNANPMGQNSPPPVPSFGAQMPGQGPPPPTDPVGAMMLEMQGGAPPPPARPPLSAPPSATPPPRDQWPAHLRTGDAAAPSKAPIDRLRQRGSGNKSAPPRKGR